MANAQHHHHHMTLNTDGRAHPVENALTFAVAVMGAVAAICAFFPDAHVLGSWVGLAGVVTGVVAQYRSETTAERWVIVVASGASAVGLALSLAHGGFY